MADQRLRILVLAPNPWDGPRMNRQHLFSRLAQRHSIVYSTGVPFFKGPTRHRPFRALKGHFERTDGLIVDHPPSWLIRNFRLQTLDDTVVALASRRWRSVLDGSHIAYLFHPGFWPHVRHLNASHVVYHAFDMYNRLASWCAEFEAWERQLVERADLVIASSSVIHDRLLALGARQTLLLENAGDYDLFASGASRDEPADLKTIPRPRVGYSGAINQKVALPLVGILAERRPELHFVLIGSVTRLGAEMERALADLRRHPNVHLLGRRPYEDMPAYVAHMDVNAIWNRVGEGLWTEGTFPLKLHEYLAAGPPVVISDIPALRQFADVVRIARDADEWERALLEAIAQPASAGLDARREVARRNTWDRRATELEHALIRLTGRPGRHDDVAAGHA